MNNPPTVVDVKRFLEHDTGMEIKLQEMSTWWKTLTDSEKAEFRASVATWDERSHFISLERTV